VDGSAQEELSCSHEEEVEEQESRRESGMIFVIPDVDMDKLSLDELKAHVAECAGAENALRRYSINVQLEIIKRLHASFPVTQAASKIAAPLKHYTKDQILGGEDEDFDSSLDDFR
jgi:hypothetical protein